MTTATTPITAIPPGSATDALCRFTCDLRADDLPAPAGGAAATTAGNALCLMVGSARHPSVDTAVSALGTLSGPDRVSVLGRGAALPGTWAALVHGIAGHVEDYDDTHPESTVHPGVPVVAAALSAAVRSGASGEELLVSVAAGVEVTLRIGRALVPEARDRGWHMTGIAAPVGAALAAARLLGLDPDAMRHAAGIAATQASGLLEALGTMTKGFQVGRAGAVGFEAALLASQGLDGPAAPLEGRRGLLALHTGSTDRAPGLVHDLGTSWEIERNEVKPYACGVVAHAVVDVARETRHQLSGPPRAVRLRVHPFVPLAMGQRDPGDGLGAKFSATHCFAVGLLHDAAGPAQFLDRVATDPDVVAVRERVELVVDDSVPLYGVRAEIVDADGTSRTLERDHPLPLDTAGLARKARELTEPVLGSRAPAFVRSAFALADTSVTDLLLAGSPG